MYNSLIYKGYPLLILTPGVKFLLLLAIVWTLAWKGVALWQAGRNGHKGWFVALFLLNTLGILDIIYIYAVAKKTKPTANS